MKKYYHVTQKKDFNSIMTKGLIPQMGERSMDVEEENFVFLFPSKEDMNTALSSWFGELFDDEIELVSLEITLPDDFPIFDSTVEYEKVSKVIIQPQYIKYLREE